LCKDDNLKYKFKNYVFTYKYKDDVFTYKYKDDNTIQNKKGKSTFSFFLKPVFLETRNLSTNPLQLR